MQPRRTVRAYVAASGVSTAISYVRTSSSIGHTELSIVPVVASEQLDVLVIRTMSLSLFVAHSQELTLVTIMT
jgi:hypothetical protein